VYLDAFIYHQHKTVLLSSMTTNTAGAKQTHRTVFAATVWHSSQPQQQHVFHTFDVVVNDVLGLKILQDAEQMLHQQQCSVRINAHARTARNVLLQR